MNCNVLKHHLLEVTLNDFKPTGVTVIEKCEDNSKRNMALADSINKRSIIQLDNVLWLRKSMLLFLRINDINCMCEDNAIVAI